MTEHKCAWCGGTATETGAFHTERYWCGGIQWGGKCDGTPSDMRDGDSAGVKGPGTWVDPSQAGDEIKDKWLNSTLYSVTNRRCSDETWYCCDPAPPAFKVGDRVVVNDKANKRWQGRTGIIIEALNGGGGYAWDMRFDDGGEKETIECRADHLSPAPAEDEPVPQPDWPKLEDYITTPVMPNCRCQTVPLTPTPQHTHTATFEFKDGHRVEVPEPGEGWEVSSREDAPAYPHIYVDSSDDTWFRSHRWINGDACFDIDHEAGRCWLFDMGRQIEEGHARIVSVTRWRRVPVFVSPPPEQQGWDTLAMTFDSNGKIISNNSLKYDHCASLADPCDDWPDGDHPKRVING